MKKAPLTRLGLMTTMPRRFILAMNQAGVRYDTWLSAGRRCRDLAFSDRHMTWTFG